MENNCVCREPGGSIFQIQVGLESVIASLDWICPTRHEEPHFSECHPVVNLKFDAVMSEI